MRLRKTILTTSHRPHPFNDTNQALRALVQPEVSLGNEMDRLRDLPGSNSEGRVVLQLRRQRGFWWGFRLVDRVRVAETGRSHPSDAWTGLRLVLREFSGQKLVSSRANATADREPFTAF